MASSSRSQQSVVVARARAMRTELTPSEQRLWLELRGGQLGVWFRRQVPLGRFVGDFVAVSARLVVEVDGGYHARRRALDAQRDRALGRLGYRVLRLEAELVMGQPAEAVRCGSCGLRSTGGEVGVERSALVWVAAEPPTVRQYPRHRGYPIPDRRAKRGRVGASKNLRRGRDSNPRYPFGYT